ncbi:MAG: hypothetical protein QM788_17485 [Roseateles sp.]|uniref:hypothetical protein n=1 Tax=Roseateles sp. TaxID=1971397 RepID=UPI0039E8528F
MASGRFIIQSGVTFQFLHVHPGTGDVAWTPSLATAVRFGVVDDFDDIRQLVDDHCDKGSALVVDLDADFA